MSEKKERKILTDLPDEMIATLKEWRQAFRRFNAMIQKEVIAQIGKIIYCREEVAEGERLKKILVLHDGYHTFSCSSKFFHVRTGSKS